MSTKEEVFALLGQYADSVYHRRGDASDLRVALESAIVEACETGLTPEQSTSSQLIEAWVETHRRACPWKVAIEITSIVTHMTDDEKARLLALDGEFN